MGFVSRSYLQLYNALCVVGWCSVMYRCISFATSGESPLWDISATASRDYGKLWTSTARELKIVQTAALLEILHALTGMVRSPVVPTTLQVFSRVAILWGFTNASAASQSDVSLLLMLVSWSAVEIVRYNFYLVQLTVGKASVPYALFWLRYSAFMLLYPSGISGELLQIRNAVFLDPSRPIMFPETFYGRISVILLLSYVPLGPFMIMNMWGNRKRAFKRGLKPRPKRPARGVSWPLVASKKGSSRSTTKTNREIWAASVDTVSEKDAEVVRGERNWRFGYVKHVRRHVELCAGSRADALRIARDGLKAAHHHFQFVRDEKSQSLEHAMRSPNKLEFETFEIRGTGASSSRELEVPYGGSDPSKPYYIYRDNKTVLKGQALLDQLKRWVARGTIEQGAADAIAMCVTNPKVMDLSSKYFVLLGATSAMGPLDVLLKYGANIIAIDLDRDFIWSKILAKARAGTGRVIFPLRASKLGKRDPSDLSDEELAKIAGCDLLADTPEIAAWLRTVEPKQAVTVGNYTYLDGGLHVQLSVACDAIISDMCDARGPEGVSVAFLCTPTDVHPITKEAWEDAKTRRTKMPTWQRIVSSLSSSLLRSNTMKPVNGMYLVDGIVSAQGPNYALAKRIQHWRAMVAYDAGHVVASNVAPSTATKSVVHASTFAAAYGGMHNFPPMEVMYQETSNAVMGALLIHDVCATSTARPSDPNSDMLKNPIELFKHGSFHGGVWRAACTIGSMGEVCFVMYYLEKYGGAILGTAAGTAGVIAWLAGLF